MATQALYLRWRPQSFGDFVGQEHIVRTLLGAIRQGRIRHAYLFSGPRGTGKTTTARLLAKAVNCLHSDVSLRPCNECSICQSINAGRFLDIIEIDAASHTGVDDVRDLREKVQFAPSQGRYKVYIIDEVHRFSGAAFDALLKTLEEPPEHAIFVLATTETNKIPDTIKSRCLVFEFRLFSQREVVARLREICDGDGIQIDDAALELVARQGTGSMRDSISLLDQIVADPDEYITFDMAQNMLGAVANQHVWALVQVIAESDTAQGLNILNAAIDDGADPRQFGRQLVDHLRMLLLIRMGSPALIDASDEMRSALKEQADIFSHAQLMKSIRAFNTAIEELRGGWQPQLPLELALIESTTASFSDESKSAPPSAPSQPPRRPENPSPSQRPSAYRPPSPQTPVSNSNPPPKTPKAAGTLNLSDFSANWNRLLAVARDKKASLESVLRLQCQPLRVDGNAVVLGVNNQTHYQSLERSREVLIETVALVFGEGVTVRLELMELTSASSTESRTVANDEFFVRAERDLGAKIQFEDHE